MLGLFNKKKPLFTAEEQAYIVASIQKSEVATSGEVRVYVESRCPHINAADRASEIFYKLKMNRTKHRNATLVYVALVDHQMAVFGDEGIHQRVGGYDYWKNELDTLKKYFGEDKIVEGIARCVEEIGQALSKHFPYEKETDKNELPDNIVFGN